MKKLNQKISKPTEDEISQIFESKRPMRTFVSQRKMKKMILSMGSIEGAIQDLMKAVAKEKRLP